MSNSIPFYQTLARKICSAGALFFNEQGQLLIVKPTYRDGWLLPGGAVEANESPRLACIREVREEIGLEVPITTLLCIDYVNDVGTTKPEALHFLFYGKTLFAEDIARIVLQVEELSEHRFIDPAQADAFLVPRLALRIPHCLRALEQRVTIYLENSALP